MNPIEAVSSFYRNYTKFAGRASRSEFWWGLLYLFLAYVICVFVGTAIMLTEILTSPAVLILFFAIGHFLPYLTLSVRRLHDTNRSGLWLLLGFVPFGGLVLLIFFVLPSTVGSNNYGPNPKAGLSDVTPHTGVGIRRFCGNCGFTLGDNVKFCPSCGAQI